MYSIKCSISENGAFRKISTKKCKPIKIPYLDFSVYANAYLKGPTTIVYQLPNVEDSTDNLKIFEYFSETADISEVWQIYAEDPNFKKCIIRRAVWEKKADKFNYFRKNEGFLKSIRQGECTDNMLFNVTLHADTVLCRDSNILRTNLLDLESKICKSLEIHDDPEQAMFIEKGLIIQVKGSCQFTFLWNYPNCIENVDVCLQEICKNMKDILNNSECEDVEIELIYDEDDFDILGI